MDKKTNLPPSEVKRPSGFPERQLVPDTEEIIIQEEIDPDAIPDEEIVLPPYEEPPPGEGP